MAGSLCCIATVVVDIELTQTPVDITFDPQVQERIEAFRAAGVTNLQVNPASDDPVATIAQVKEML